MGCPGVQPKMRAKEMGDNKTGEWDWDPGAAFLAVLRIWDKSLLVSASPLSFGKLIIRAVSGPMKTVDCICKDK